MDKKTFSHYGWIVIVVIIICILISGAPGLTTTFKINLDRILTDLDKVQDDALDDVPDGFPDNIDFSKLAPGLYETGTDYLLKPWDELVDENILAVENGVLILENSYDAYSSSSISTASITNTNSLIATYAESVSKTLTGYLVVDAGVTSIDDYGFHRTQQFTGIVLSDTVTSIGAASFGLCEDFLFVVFPENLTNIDDLAFSDCPKLKKVSIPASVEHVGTAVFSGCQLLSEISVDPENKNYSSSGNCLIETDSKTLIQGCVGSTIPNDGSVTSIGTGAFYWCYELKNLNIPDSVTSIGDMALFGCSGLETITVGQNNPTYKSSGNCLIETASKTLLLGCENSTIPSDGSVTTIADYAFYDCEELKTIHIASSITNISDFAICACPNLTSITVDEENPVYKGLNNCLIDISSGTILLGCKNSTIPSDPSVTAMSNTAFSNCIGLKNIVIPGNIKTVPEQTFSGCKDLESVVFENGVETIEIRAFTGCTSLKNVTFGNTIKTIKNYAFDNCPITSVTVPASVTSLQFASFPTQSITKITIEPENAVYYSSGNCIIEKATGTLIAGYANSIIPDNGSVLSIKDYAFYQSSISSISIPSSVTQIGESAFYECPNLTNIVIPDGVSIIQSYTFRGCTSLTSVTIPSSVTQIKIRAIANCTSLTDIYFEGTIAQWNAISFNKYWDADNSPYTVHCADGNITK